MANLIQVSFPTEVAGTYYIKGVKGGNTAGKLRNQYLSYRSELSKVDLFQRRQRQKEFNSTQEIIVEDFGDAVNLIESENVENFDMFCDAWDQTKQIRKEDLKKLGPISYFNKFPFLSTGAGHLVVNYCL